MAGQEKLEHGDKILLPMSALDALTRFEVRYPMMFQLSNDVLGTSTHVGVMEFDSEEQRCYVPSWIMRNLGIAEGGFVRVTNVSLPKATHVTFRPQTSDFTTLSNPKALLEMELKNFSCMTVGQPISIHHAALKKNFVIDVLELRPAVSRGYVCSCEREREGGEN